MEKSYIVKAGDTLYGISNQYGVSVTDLANANNISVNTTLKIGQKLTIPSTLGTNPNTTFIYTVKKGDNLYNIAKKYNTTISEITKLNNLKTNNLSIGQQLKIPETYTKEEEMTMPVYINYNVKKGDSLYSIANKYNTTVDMIMKDNGLSKTTLQIGQNLKIRIIGDNIEIEECFGEKYTPPSTTQSTTQNYIVKKGDSLYSIAKKFNTTIDNIKNKNNLKNNLLTIGQKIII